MLLYVAFSNQKPIRWPLQSFQSNFGSTQKHYESSFSIEGFSNGGGSIIWKQFYKNNDDWDEPEIRKNNYLEVTLTVTDNDIMTFKLIGGWRR